MGNFSDFALTRTMVTSFNPTHSETGAKAIDMRRRFFAAVMLIFSARFALTQYRFIAV